MQCHEFETYVSFSTIPVLFTRRSYLPSTVATGYFWGVSSASTSSSDQPSATRDEADEEARRILRTEMQRYGVTYKVLARRLTEAGYPETERALISKVSRGSFSFAFAVRALRAIGVVELDLRPPRRPGPPRR